MAGRGAYQKKAQNIVNVRARHELLIDWIKAPHSLNKSVRANLVTQRAFAALNLPNLKITPIALNTLKSLSDDLFADPDKDGHVGFAYLDALRVRLGASLSKLEATRTVTVKAKRAEDNIGNLMGRLAATEAQGVKRLRAYLSLYSAVNGLIKNGGLQADAQERLYKVMENHHAAFADLLEPNNSSTIGDGAAVTRLHLKKTLV